MIPVDAFDNWVSSVPSNQPYKKTFSGDLAGKTVKALTLGNYHSCVISSDDKVHCWGYNLYGQVGKNNWDIFSNTTSAVYTGGVMSGKSITQVSAGDSHTCALSSDSNIYCWGYNEYGQLGDGTVNSSAAPIQVNFSSEFSNKIFKSIDASSNSTCAMTTSNEKLCWGLNNIGQFGDGTQTNSLTPVLTYT